MNVHEEFTSRIRTVVGTLERKGVVAAGVIDRIQVSEPRQADHGDLASNAALVLAGANGMAPREIADLIIGELRQDPDVATAVSAGPGFINITLRESFWHTWLERLLAHGPDVLLADRGQGRKACVEYVSANPTGPLHVGTARGAVIGDVLASLLEVVGWKVTREYYINDAGAQVDVLAWSAYVRYLEALGEPPDVAVLEALYPGDYLIETGKDLAGRYGTTLKQAVGDRQPGQPAVAGASRGGPLLRY